MKKDYRKLFTICHHQLSKPAKSSFQKLLVFLKENFQEIAYFFEKQFTGNQDFLINARLRSLF